MQDLRAGQQFACGPFVATVLPDADFETYSEAGYNWNPQTQKWESLPGLSNQNRGLKAVGTRNYVQHPSFEILSLAYDLKDGRGKRRWVPPQDLRRYEDYPFIHSPHPIDLLTHVAAGSILEAWNVGGFEWHVWNFYCVPKWGWPELKIEQCRCAMAKSRAASYPGTLEDAGRVLKLTEQKDKAGHDLIRKLTVPRNPTKTNPALRWTPFTASEDFKRFYAYNEQDIRAEAEASLRLPDLSPRELSIFLMDFRINARGMHLDDIAVENCIAIVEQAFAKYNAELRELTGGAAQHASEVQKILAWLGSKHGIWLSELDEETLDAELKKAHPREALRVLRVRQMLAFGSVKKLYAMRYNMTREHRLHDQYSYYGAHTSLWNGRSVQMANLYSGIFKKSEEVEQALAIISFRSLELVEAAYAHVEGGALEVIASCLRSMVVAKPGHKLISADFSALQAIVTSCLAGEQWRIDVFRTHGKIYEMMASLLTGKSFEYYLDYKAKEKKHHPDRQIYGKIPVLSADFGAWINGWKKFGADKLGDDNKIKEMILLTRSRIPMIVEMWGGQTRRNGWDKRQELYGLEGCAIAAVKEPGNAFGYRNMVYQMYEDTLYCRLPSGDFMRYHTPRLDRSSKDWAQSWELDLTYWGWNSNATKGAPGWQEMSLYGGVLTQNNVANQSRQIQADSLLALEEGVEGRQYPIVMHTHDEGVAEVPDRPEYNTKEYTQIVKASLGKWARLPDGSPWPIIVPEAWEAYRYGKWGD